MSLSIPFFVSFLICMSQIHIISCETGRFNGHKLKRPSSSSSPLLSSSETIQKSNQHNVPHSYKNILSSSSTSTAIKDFHNDFAHLEAQPLTNLTTPCIVLCRDTTYTKLWTLDDWKKHSKHSLSRYASHVLTWPTSTTMQNVIGTVILVGLWSAAISTFANKSSTFQTSLTKFTVTMTFLQAPILLLLTLRTNRALDRLLETRKAWGLLGRATRSLMGLVCAHIMPTNPELGCIIGRHVAICGWLLKGYLRDEDDTNLIKAIMKSTPEEAEWLLQQKEMGSKSTHAAIHRLRSLFSNRNNGNFDIDPIILLRMEEILYDIESSVGICARVLISPIPPTYTRHTSRVLALYMFMLPIALVGMGLSTLAVVFTSVIASYILVGIDEIGLEIENPFPLMPLFNLSKGVQKEVERQVKMMVDIPSFTQN
mmetsp:Transcript_21871/g.24891  ORF Transcript_21871/g.24891 Transcript_21871/m.24891 type:complete len:426 (+) Transcript_21871:83-1360(+)